MQCFFAGLNRASCAARASCLSSVVMVLEVGVFGVGRSLTHAVSASSFHCTSTPGGRPLNIHICRGIKKRDTV